VHELALVEEMLMACWQAAASHGVTKVSAVHITVGQMAACPDALRFAWEACRGRFPPLREAALQIQTVPATWACAQCRTEYRQPVGRCPACGTALVPLQSGLQLRVDYVETEDDQRGPAPAAQPAAPPSGEVTSP
jgi:hydrogenase nickel insertion protein HypA